MNLPLERTGTNERWVNGLHDWKADEMRASFAMIDAEEVSTCDVLLGCDEPPVWAVRLHDCHLYVACDRHCQLIYEEVMTDLCSSGIFMCLECDQTFSRQADVIRSWKI